MIGPVGGVGALVNIGNLGSIRTATVAPVAANVAPITTPSFVSHIGETSMTSSMFGATGIGMYNAVQQLDRGKAPDDVARELIQLLLISMLLDMLK